MLVGMKHKLNLLLLFLAAGLLAAISCRRSDLRMTTISVPQMADARSIRIVTNAALDEVVGRYDGTKNDCEVDLANSAVLYHEGQRLLSSDYQRQIEDRIREIGYEARVIRAGLNPPAPVPTGDGPIQIWPDRFTALIAIRGMKDNTDANRIVDAITYARLGTDSPRVALRAGTRKLIATYEGISLSPRNIEYAIAGVGFSANGVEAKLGAADAPAMGWTPVKL
jgi:hypothetical protein